MKEKNNELEYFANQLKKKRKEKGLSQMDLAKLIGMSAGSIGMYELGLTDPRRSVVKKLADKLDVDESYFYNYTFSNKTTNEAFSYDIKKIPVTILGKASCGNGYSNNHTTIEYIEVPEEWVKGEVYAAYASGDSMNGEGIVDGSLVLFKPSQELHNNQIGVFCYKDEEFIKRFKKYGKIIVLESANPSHPNVEVTNPDELRIIGKVIRSIKEFN